MVCNKCEKKLSKVICPDKWKDGSRNTAVGTDRKLHENKLLSKPGKSRFKPYENKCKICKSRVHQEHAHYCQGCAYKQGICAMCGKQILDTSIDLIEESLDFDSSECLNSDEEIGKNE
ncbi:10716_t:CDS:2 [Funneliformis geosporum]|uniref:Cysteine-rich PDZ-binding protein n=1 Tax=Funneliformis geosporum TaxID=1117311 RepID=A0A9W4T398_9GLOM|nr:13507_t:CDS:2 [Funneliformis geosporum]CAI2191716.1 10716_t:CDS:2 [Funneliformis geosporum]